MSAIGDYVHLTAAGYYEHGTKRFDKKGQSDFNLVPRIFQQQKEKFKEKLSNKQSNAIKNFSEAEQKDFSKALKLLMKPSGSEQQIEELNSIWNLLTEQLQQQWSDRLGTIQRDCANVFSEDSSFIKDIQGLTKIDTKGKNNNSRKIYLTTVLKRIKIIENAMRSIETTPKLQELGKKINLIYENLAKAINVSQEALKSTGYNFNEKIQQYEFTSDITDLSSLSFLQEQYGGVIKAINSVIGSTSGVDGLQKGILFERMGAIAPIICKQKTVEEIRLLLKKVVGNQKTETQLDFSNFYKGINLNTVLGKHYQQVNDHLMVSTSGTQDKVDVNLRWNRKTVPLSLKNVNLRSGHYIHLVTTAPLLLMIAGLNSTYVNHLLNVMAQHNFERDSGTIEDTLLNEAHHSLKRILMLQALQGYKAGASKADFFVVNDNTTGNVVIYSIPKLVLDAMEDIDSFIEVTSGKNDIDTIRFTNDFNEEDYDKRITKLIANVHAQKISVGLNPAKLTGGISAD